MSKSADAFKTISEVADALDVQKHVLRFWEVKFPQIRPMKRGGGRRYYRPEDLVLLRGIQHLLHAEGYTIKGVQKILREQGIEHVKVHGQQVEAQVVAKAAKAAAARAGRDGATAQSGRVRALPKSKSARKDAAVPTLHEAVEAAIAELKACRDLLSAADPASSASTTSTRARPKLVSRAGR